MLAPFYLTIAPFARRLVRSYDFILVDQSKRSAIWSLPLLCRYKRSVASHDSSTPPLAHALVDDDPGKLQPEPFGEFFDAHPEVLELKPPHFDDRTSTSLPQNAPADIPVRAERVNQLRSAFDEIFFVWLHHFR